MPVRASEVIPQREILTVVIVEKQMVIGVMCSSVDEFLQQPWDPVVTIMNGDGPYVNKHIEAQVEYLVQGEEERVDVVGYSLKKAIYRVECVAGERSRDLPEVVRFMETLIDQFVMQESVNPVDAHIGEKEEGEHAKDQSWPTQWRFTNIVVELAVASYFSKEQCHCGNADPRQRRQSKLYFTSHLVL